MIEWMTLVVWILMMITLISAALLIVLIGALWVLGALVRRSPRRARKH